MVSPIDPRVDKVDYYEMCANIDILSTQALFETIYSQDIIDNYEFCNIFKSIPIQKILPLNLNKGFIEPTCITWYGPVTHVYASARYFLWKSWV